MNGTLQTILCQLPGYKAKRTRNELTPHPDTSTPSVSNKISGESDKASQYDLMDVEALQSSRKDHTDFLDTHNLLQKH